MSTPRTHSDREIRLLVARSSVGEHHAPLNLAGANLELANLPHVDLRGANLRGANLRGAMLWGAKLDGACLDGADLSCANLTWCTFYDCSMEGTLLIEADLDEATLSPGSRGAVLVGAVMNTVSFGLSPAEAKRLGAQRESLEASAQRATTKAEEQALLAAHRKTAPAAVRKRGAARGGSKLKQLWQAQARILSDADLRELLRYSAETGRPLNLRGCNLAGANLKDAALEGACLAFTNLTATNLHGARLRGVDFTDSWGCDPARASEDWTSMQPFVLTGLISRGGLSNWTFFFFPQSVVLMDAGAAPAVRAAVIGASDLLTVVLGDPAYGAQPGQGLALVDWYEQLRSTSEDIRQYGDAEIERVRLHLRLSAHELFITGSDGVVARFGLMNRQEIEPLIGALQQRFGARFEVSATALFAFFQRHASFLTR